MSGGSNRRFPRTARALAEPSPTIEREKIRHRRPNDLLFDGPEPPPSSHAPLIDDLDDGRHAGDAYSEDDSHYVDEPSDWAEDDDAVPAASAWDEESEDDWVLHGEGDTASRSDLFDEGVGRQDDYVEIYDDEEESGVVWEEDDTVPDHLSFEQPDEIALGQEKQSFGFAPEVELAGRRDVRPKPPRPAPAQRPAAARRPARQQRMAGEPRGRRRDEGRLPLDRSGEAELQSRPAPLEPRQRSDEAAARPSAAPADTDRFSRTRATLGMPAGGMAAGADDQVLQQPRRATTGRRRQAQKAPSPPSAPNMPKRDRYGAITSRRGRTKGVVALLLFALLTGGGWYGYRTFGLEGVQPMVDRLTTLIPLPGMSRTAADTSFDEGETAGSLSAEQALSDLEQRVEQSSGGGQSGAGGPSDDPIDPATIDAVGPPIPAFKPTPLGATRSLAADAPAGSGDQAQLAANGENEGGEPSILEQLWQFLRPG